MAVDIDVVYQTVLALANKEQRGYITPQEFNLFANHAQKEIFEQYFYDRQRSTKIPSNKTEFSDLDKLLEEKIQIFTRSANLEKEAGYFLYPAGTHPMWRLGVVLVGDVLAEEVSVESYRALLTLPLLSPTTKRPIYVKRETGLFVIPSNDLVQVTYVTAPKTVSWGYFVIGNKALYDNGAGKTTHFELHPSEESELVYKILKLAGVGMRREDIARVGQVQEQAQQQQEKQ